MGSDYWRVRIGIGRPPHEAMDVKSWVEESLVIAQLLANEETANCEKIGINGADLIRDIADSKNGDTVNILTHCNAGWLATVDWGTALAPIYASFDSGISVHVWVDESPLPARTHQLTAPTPPPMRRRAHLLLEAAGLQLEARERPPGSQVDQHGGGTGPSPGWREVSLASLPHF